MVSNATYLSKMATGEMPIHDFEARAIEKRLNLPSGWMDRDSIAILNMSPEDHAILKLLEDISNEGKAALHTFIAATKKSEA